MNRSVGFTVAAAAGLILALAGCSSHGKVKAGLASASANPAVVQAEAKVKNCVATELVKGKNAVISCIAPAGSKAAVTTCVQGVIASGSFVTKAGRLAAEQAAANCVVTHG